MAQAASDPTAEAEARRVMERYFNYGDKASGGPGDNATGAWLESELVEAGYACRRQPFDAPGYEGDAATLVAGAARAAVIPQAIVTSTGPGGVTAPLAIGPRASAISILVLPHARWSAVVGEVERRIRTALTAGAKGVVVVTTGPTGEALALNAPIDKPLFDRPVAVIGPRDAAPFLKAAEAGETATLTIPGRAIRRPAYNLTARLNRGAARNLVLSTPRSGWFTCAGERGPGLAVWLALAKWAARTPLPVNVALVCTSGHEYDNGGGEHFIHEIAPKPAETALWVHLGANVAARDWHERGAMLSPLPSADPQRFLLASTPLVDRARTAFAGLQGLEAVYTADPALAAGELGVILKAGYAPAIGIFGGHRFHHAPNDDLRCVVPALIPPVTEAFKAVIQQAVA